MDDVPWLCYNIKFNIKYLGDDSIFTMETMI